MELNIAGLQPLSTVDWPGKLAAVLFLQGCPWACPYCHNFEILDPRRPGAVPWTQVQQLLERRRGLLDGVVFSGGEATMQPALLLAMAEVKEAGYHVGLHTGGAYPGRLAALLDAGVVDWVGLDIKALPEDYADVAGTAAAGRKAAESLGIVLAHPSIDYEVRLTLWRGDLDYARRVAQWCADLGVTNFVLQRLSEQHLPPQYVGPPPAWQTPDAVEMLGDIGFASVVVRE